MAQMRLHRMAGLEASYRNRGNGLYCDSVSGR